MMNSPPQVHLLHLPNDPKHSFRPEVFRVKEGIDRDPECARISIKECRKQDTIRDQVRQKGPVGDFEDKFHRHKSDCDRERCETVIDVDRTKEITWGTFVFQFTVIALRVHDEQIAE